MQFTSYVLFETAKRRQQLAGMYVLSACTKIKEPQKPPENPSEHVDLNISWGRAPEPHFHNLFPLFSLSVIHVSWTLTWAPLPILPSLRAFELHVCVDWRSDSQWILIQGDGQANVHAICQWCLYHCFCLLTPSTLLL